MQSLGARPLRILAEYFDPLVRLRRANVGDTIVMFGSARIQPRDRAIGRTQTGAAGSARPKEPRMALKVRAARSIVEMSRYYEEARELSRRITAMGHDARAAPEALCDLLGRRPRDHGSGKPRRGRSRRQLDRLEHPASARAAPERLHHARS